MATVLRFLVAVALVFAAAAAAAAQPGPTPANQAWVESLKSQWSKPVGGKTRLVGVEEYGRCSVFVDNGAVQVVTPAGDIAWTWAFRKISKYLNPSEVAVSHQCDAIALVGDASYKYVWIVDQAGTSASIKLTATPADVEFDRNGTLVAIGTYDGSILLYSRNGSLRWERDTQATIVQRLAFSDDNTHLHFTDWAGSGVVSVAGRVEWSRPTPAEERDHPNMTDFPYYRWVIAMSEDDERFWLRGETSIDCVDRRGVVLATIEAMPGERGVKVSRDFSQVLVVTEKDLRPVSVERYEIPAPCSTSRP